ncbi:hypothetical protein AMELA_G00255600 [Ameiurus melas]|uniref:Ig-like domain-containing protein n=1 Tax=Ameiurus melas TaxID=219545 RepID=A0A7J5ZR74_AMEME|nr:hypothetical protein AMELA_G00255600 [Ameiurus melas]
MGSAKSRFKLIGPSGTEWYNPSAVTLSCRLSPEISAVNMEIRWFKGTDCVCVYKNRHVTKGRGYAGRVSLFTQELENANVSLQLRDYTGSDSGHYLCQVIDGDITEEITVMIESTKWWLFSENYISVCHRARKWTKVERMKMEYSALCIAPLAWVSKELDFTLMVAADIL